MVKGLYPTEERMYNLLLDGINHSDQELHLCLDDELSSVDTIQAWISKLRKKLQPYRLHILRVRIDDRNYYRMVRVMSLGE